MRFDRCPAENGLPERWRWNVGSRTAIVVPSAGMNLVSLETEGRERLVLPLPLEEFMATEKTGGVPLLHPWANRLRGDRYVVGGRTVDLSSIRTLKRDGNGLPMHGLVLRGRPWSIRTADDPAAGAEIEGTLVWNADIPDFEAFPFVHRLIVRWRLVAGSDSSVAAACTYRVEAGDGPVPLGAGWHPYLRPAVGCDRNDITLETPSLRRVALDERGLPVRGDDGELVLDGANSPAGPLGDRRFDDLFRAPSGGWSAAVEAIGTRIEIEADGGWRWMQIYAPEGSDYACIEPMLAPTAGLSDGRVTTVEAGDAFEASFEIRVAATEGRSRG